MKKEINMVVDISVDEVLSELEFVDVLKWYCIDLGKETFAEILREELDLL